MTDEVRLANQCSQIVSHVAPPPLAWISPASRYERHCQTFNCISDKLLIIADLKPHCSWPLPTNTRRLFSGARISHWTGARFDLIATIIISDSLLCVSPRRYFVSLLAQDDGREREWDTVNHGPMADKGRESKKAHWRMVGALLMDGRLYTSRSWVP